MIYQNPFQVSIGLAIVAIGLFAVPKGRETDLVVAAEHASADHTP